MLLILFVLWIVFNSAITIEICVIGLVIVAMLYFFMHKFMDYRIKKDKHIFRCIGFGICYIGVLIYEILKSNFKVMRIVLNKNIPVHQTVVHFDVPLHTEFAKAVLANSITLTPGTITVSVDGGRYTVHCLDKSMIDGIESSRFVKLLRKMEARNG